MGAEEPDEHALSEAYRHEDTLADVASQTVGIAWLFAIVPAMLVLLLVSALLGDSIWRLLPVLAVTAIVAPLLARLAVRWRSDLPITLPGRVPIVGARKKRLLLAAVALAVAAMFVELLWPVAYGWLRNALIGWRR